MAMPDSVTFSHHAVVRKGIIFWVNCFREWKGDRVARQQAWEEYEIVGRWRVIEVEGLKHLAILVWAGRKYLSPDPPPALWFKIPSIYDHHTCFPTFLFFVIISFCTFPFSFLPSLCFILFRFYTFLFHRNIFFPQSLLPIFIDLIIQSSPFISFLSFHLSIFCPCCSFSFLSLSLYFHPINTHSHTLSSSSLFHL